MIYREPQPVTRQELEVYIENQDEALGEKILGYILHAQDSNEALQLLADDRIWSSNDEATRGIAVLCVGHHDCFKALTQQWSGKLWVTERWTPHPGFSATIMTLSVT